MVVSKGKTGAIGGFDVSWGSSGLPGRRDDLSPRRGGTAAHAERPGRRPQASRSLVALGVRLALVTLIPGILVLVWPDETLHILAVIIGLQLLVAGVFRFVTAFSHSQDGVAGWRACWSRCWRCWRAFSYCGTRCRRSVRCP
ncbi:DUF308 domain-containing protein [Streptomyces cirratus]